MLKVIQIPILISNIRRVPGLKMDVVFHSWVNFGILEIMKKYASFHCFDNLRLFKVSKVIGCQMVRQKDMDFTFNHGSCNAFLEPTPKILLCFDENNERECHT